MNNNSEWGEIQIIFKYHIVVFPVIGIHNTPQMGHY